MNSQATTLKTEDARHLRTRAIGVGLGVLVVYLASALWMPERGFWINDTALKFIQLRSIVEHGEIALDWPGRAIDPEQAFGPITRGFFAMRDGELYSAYSPVFPALSAPFYQLLGARGILVIPLLGILLGLPAVWRIAVMLAEGTASASRAGTWAVLSVAFGTPVWFYALAFWEHAPAVGFSCWSLWCVLHYERSGDRRFAALAGAMTAAPIYFRTEGYLFAAVVLSLTAWNARRHIGDVALLAAGAFVTLLPLWIFHALVLGNPLGLHLTTQPWGDTSLMHYVSERVDVASRLLLNLHTDPMWSFALALPFVAALFGGHRVRAEAQRLGIPFFAMAACIAGGLYLWSQLSSPHPMNRLMQANGLFSAAPFMVLAFVAPAPNATTEARRAHTTLLAICFLYAVLYTALIPGVNSQGIHWGCRFLLVIYPVLAVVASVCAVGWWERFGERRLLSAGVLAVFVLSAGLQAYSLVMLHDRKAFSQALNARVQESDSEIIISDTWFIPVDLSASFFEKPVFFAPPKRRKALLAKATAAGVQSVLVVDDALRKKPAPESELFGDGWLNFSPVALKEHRAARQ